MEGSEKPENLKKYDLQFTGIGNGVTVWNKAMPIYEGRTDSVWWEGIRPKPAKRCCNL